MTYGPSFSLSQSSAYADSGNATYTPGFSLAQTSAYSGTLSQTANGALTVSQNSGFSTLGGQSFTLSISLSLVSAYAESSKLTTEYLTVANLPQTAAYGGTWGQSYSSSVGYSNSTGLSLLRAVPTNVSLSLSGTTSGQVGTIIGDVWRTALTPRQRILPVPSEIRSLSVSPEIRVLTPQENRVLVLPAQSRTLTVQP